MSNIGIFVGYNAEELLLGETNPHLYTLIKYLLNDKNNKITIALPVWQKAIFEQASSKAGIEKSRVKILTTSKIPSLFRINRYISGKVQTKSSLKHSPTKWRSTVKKLDSILTQTIHRWLSITFLPLFFATSFFVLLQAIVIGGIIVASIVCIRIRYKSRFITHRLRKYFHPYIQKIKTRFGKTIRDQSLREELEKKDFEKLSVMIKTQNNINLWFIPEINSPEIAALTGKKVLALSDTAFFNFPSLYLDKITLVFLDNIKKTIAGADHYLYQSKRLSQDYLIQNINIDPDKISIIEPSYSCLNETTFKSTSALPTIERYKNEKLKSDPYLSHYDFSVIKFIYCNYNHQPYNNLMILIKAHEALTKTLNYSIKLIISGDLSKQPHLLNYINENKLQYDILNFPSCSQDTIKALYHLAICSINPSLFEPCFPNSFIDAYSVGTPSLLSNIPVIAEQIVNQDLHQQMLFDPYDLQDLTSKLEWAIKNKTHLYDAQKSLYTACRSRSFSSVAREYDQFLKKLAS